MALAQESSKTPNYHFVLRNLLAGGKKHFFWFTNFRIV